MKYYIETKEKDRMFIFETDISAAIDKTAAGMTANNDISGIIPFSLSVIDSTIKVRYDVTAFTPLSEIIRSCLGRDKVLAIVESIYNIINEAEEYLIEPHSFFMDPDCIFIDKNDFSVHMICLPVIDSVDENPEIKDFFKDLVFRLRFDSSENCDYIGKMLGYINSGQEFCLSDFIAVIRNSLSYGNEIMPPADKIQNNDEKQDDIFSNDILCDSDEEKNCPEYKIQQEIKIPDNIYQVEDEEYLSEEAESSSIPGFFGKIFRESRSRQTRKKDVSERSSTSFNKTNGEFISSDETELIAPPEETVPYLVRTKNNEKIILEKNKFRIGTDRRNTDYCICDNNAVSRIHAEIRRKNGSLYLVDKNSTNHTYVNKKAVRSNSEIKLSDSCNIRFANEEFVVYM